MASTLSKNQIERIEQLDTLFDFATPESIQKSLRSVLFNYLMSIQHDTTHNDFEKVVSDFYYLTDFMQMEIDKRDSKDLS